jgi:hypothetical protein
LINQNLWCLQHRPVVRERVDVHFARQFSQHASAAGMSMSAPTKNRPPAKTAWLKRWVMTASSSFAPAGATVHQKQTTAVSLPAGEGRLFGNALVERTLSPESEPQSECSCYL